MIAIRIGCAALALLVSACGANISHDPITAGPQGFVRKSTCSRPCIRAEYPIPTSNSGPTIITPGPDGNLWFTEQTAHQIAKITNAGEITEYPVNAVPGDITAGPDGNLWFISIASPGGVGKITPDGIVTLYPLGTSDTLGIASGPDGNIWFTAKKCTQYYRNQCDRIVSSVYKMSTAGVILARYKVSSEFLIHADRITTGPDENLWFTEWGGAQIGRITSSGNITKFSGPLNSAYDKGIAAGVDGKIWFTDPGNDEVGKISVHGMITEYPIPTTEAFPTMITAGSESMWFTEQAADKVGRITPSGVVTEFQIPTTSSGPAGIARGSDGNIWFTENAGNKIGELVP